MNTKTDDSLLIDLPDNRRPSLSIELVTGEVEVVGWDRPQIKLTSSDADEDATIEDLFSLRQDGSNFAVNVNHGGGSKHKKYHPRDEWDFDAMIRQASNSVRGISADLKVYLPFNCDLAVRTASGDIQVKKVDGEISAHSASGGVTLDDVQGSVQIKSASGEVEVSHFSGSIDVRTMSGEITIHGGDIDSLSLGTASGDVDISGRFTGNGAYEIQTVSGDVDLQLPEDSSGTAEIQTVSGDIECELRHETQKNGKRRQRITINGGDGFDLRINTTSGDVEIGRWAGAPKQRQPRPAVTERLDNPGNGEQFRTSDANSGQTVRMNVQQAVERDVQQAVERDVQGGPATEMEVLKAIENGTMSVEDGIKILTELRRR